MNHKEITITDVARLAGVSKRTVSRVINKSSKVGKATRVKIQKIIDELNFKPNAHARGLASRRSYLLGMIYDNPDAFYVDGAQRGMLSVCRESGYELVVHPCDRNSDSLTDEAITFVNRCKLDGVLILPPISENDELAEALRAAGLNYVRLASIALDTPEHVVISNERAAVSEMTEYLIGLGHQRIGYVTGPKGLKSTQQRREGFYDTMKKHNLEIADNLIAQGDYSFESGMASAIQLLKLLKRPTAIFASNDEMAVGVINAAQNMRLSVPDELSVAGFDDSILASRIIPQITTIRRPVREMARLATAKLIATIDGRLDDARVGVSLVPSLVIRSSTKARQA